MGEEENEKKDLNRWNNHIPHFLRIHSLLPLTLFLTVLAPPWLLMEETEREVWKRCEEEGFRVLSFFSFFLSAVRVLSIEGFVFFWVTLLLCDKDTDRTVSLNNLVRIN